MMEQYLFLIGKNLPITLNLLKYEPLLFCIPYLYMPYVL